MTHVHLCLVAAAAVVAFGGCGGSNDDAASDSSSTGMQADDTTGAAQTGPDGTTAQTGGPQTGSTSDAESGTGADGSTGTGSSSSGGAGDLSCEGLPAFVAAFKEAHSGNGGMDWDILTWSEAEIAADPDAMGLFSLCEEDQVPLFPELAWEYGGLDHAWIMPEASPLYMCVHIPVNPGTKHWSYDDVIDEVTADLMVGCPEANPCNDEEGADQVMACLGDASNIEIIVDTASRNDGIDQGYDLSEASTQLYLILEGGERVHMYTGL